MLKRLLILTGLTIFTICFAFAQDDDIDAAMKKALETANQPASKADMKKLDQQAKGADR